VADYELMLRFILRHGVRTAYITEVLVRMRVGGASNKALAARFNANRMDRLTWQVKGRNLILLRSNGRRARSASMFAGDEVRFPGGISCYATLSWL